MGWLKKMFSPDTYEAEWVKRTFEPESGFFGELNKDIGIVQTTSDNIANKVGVKEGPVSALMTAKENTNEAMKRLFRMGVYIAPMFGGEQSALASTKLFGN